LQDLEALAGQEDPEAQEVLADQEHQAEEAACHLEDHPVARQPLHLLLLQPLHLLLLQPLHLLQHQQLDNLETKDL
jgi:hypothetical protein